MDEAAAAAGICQWKRFRRRLLVAETVVNRQQRRSRRVGGCTWEDRSPLGVQKERRRILGAGDCRSSRKTRRTSRREHKLGSSRGTQRAAQAFRAGESQRPRRARSGSEPTLSGAVYLSQSPGRALEGPRWPAVVGNSLFSGGLFQGTPLPAG